MTCSNVKFLRLHSVIDLTGLSKSSIYKQINEGTFPEQVRIGGRAVAWLDLEIDDWMTQCVETRFTDIKTENNVEV